MLGANRSGWGRVLVGVSGTTEACHPTAEQER